MSKAVSSLFGNNKKSKAQQRQAQEDRAQAQSDRMADQARILNERNNQSESEVRAARGGRRGRRQLAYRGQEASLRSTLGAGR